MRFVRANPVVLAAFILGATSVAEAGEGAFGWLSGDWYLTVGATGLVAPDFEGSKSYILSAQPIISLGKAGPAARFTSRNDNISLGLIDEGGFRAGLAGKILFSRDGDDADELRGLDPVRWGGEAGGFFEFYPLDWVRARAELRHGIRAHSGFVADIAADAFYDVTPEVRISGGPRVSFASSDYFDAYYGVDAGEAVASGLSRYRPGGGVKSAGLGGAVTWKVTEPMTASLFGEYARLMGPAADSSLVKERGSRDQFTIGVSTTYRFDFSM
ncbi:MULTISPECIES: MipA/OmpV family protein [unclassified Mesorhizobium]|uniref:MipA/OmpV family protein n=1 Tax=unclassified Mesorhizobium TaxID=325217 RepID=UPI000FEA5DD7|nr:MULTISPECIES: MipA/OmpV family protein [unclassified Mesorhizobium]RWI13726.1 MAG: MipA/OmpV family protein [Mesorhizobium sp.]RWK47622.1 MAG: MipA/OmpV family protein [Mesorhizobium sp.]RWK93126.1 MAG: MipA/OmpV family protein [Mesorhizobium sp.]RWK98784.1 MAG: MipA/OmpV family protein [Mesorhizobium sp.]TIQ25956.1 MAG: MipA/OmpV family protein [Mesorhizobium sp.]